LSSWLNVAGLTAALSLSPALGPSPAAAAAAAAAVGRSSTDQHVVRVMLDGRRTADDSDQLMAGLARRSTAVGPPYSEVGRSAMSVAIRPTAVDAACVAGNAPCTSRHDSIESSGVAASGPVDLGSPHVVGTENKTVESNSETDRIANHRGGEWTRKNVRISTDILWRVFHILTEPVPYTFVSVDRLKRLWAHIAHVGRGFIIPSIYGYTNIYGTGSVKI